MASKTVSSCEPVVAACIEGYVQNRPDLIAAAIPALASESDRLAAVVLCEAGMNPPPTWLSQADQACTRSPCADLLVCVLNALCKYEQGHDRIETIPGLLSRMQACLPAVTHPRTRGMVHRIAHSHAKRTLYLREARDAMRRGIAEAGDDPDQLLEFQFKFVEASLYLREFADLKPLIANLTLHSADLRRFGLSLEQLDLHLALFDGRAAELAALAPNIPPQETQRS